MSTPRSAGFPVYRGLAILNPELSKQLPDSPAMLEAQKEMAWIQSIGRTILTESEDVNRVAWEPDENWLRGKGINPGQL